MNLLCPNCQKMLTVPEQYAGQLMKCPLCAGTFTVPALPPAPSVSESVPPPPSSSSTAPSPSQPDTYTLRQEPASTSPPPAPPPPISTTPEPSTAAIKSSAPAPTFSPPLGYTRTDTLWFSPKVLQWVPSACVVLIFILQFFTWNGVFPGGVAAYRQGAWSAAFATGEADHDLDEIARVDEKGLGLSAGLIFYVLLFLPTLLVTLAVPIILRVKLPPLPSYVQQLLPYRWGIVTILNLLVFLFLLLQLVLGFGLESYWKAKVDAKYPVLKDAKTQQIKENEAYRGIQLDYLRRTVWLRLVVLLHVVAILAAVLMYWLNRRGESRPLPKIELQY